MSEIQNDLSEKIISNAITFFFWQFHVYLTGAARQPGNILYILAMDKKHITTWYCESIHANLQKIYLKLDM
jgi:hypothetical protein